MERQIPGWVKPPEAEFYHPNEEVSGDDRCGIKRFGHYCTREKGHSGNHEAIIVGEQPIFLDNWKPLDLRNLWNTSTQLQRYDMLWQDTFDGVYDLLELSNKSWDELPVIVQIKIFKKRMG